MVRFIKEVTWDEVFEGWRSREANNPGWIKTATEIKGWSDWESWRKFTASQIGAEKRIWKIYEFTNPMNDIPAMLVGPYGGWQEKLPVKNKYTFEELLNFPQNYSFFKKHQGVSAIMENFPASTEFIGLIRKDGRVVCLEGHHRATAVALAKKEDKNIDFKGVTKIALAELAEREYSLLDKILERGTSKIPQ